MKVLIISHNPVSEQSSMGKTFLSLFSQFDAAQLCQLYIYPTIPNGHHCGSYYRVTDKEALKSAVLRRPIGAEIAQERIICNQAAYEKAGDEQLYRSRKNKSALRRLFRDTMWSMSVWYHDGLKDWLDRQAPDCIFLAPGVAKFIYDFALRISKDRNIPIVAYICDEYYFVQRPGTMADRVRLKLLQNKMDALMQKSSHLVVISQELHEQYTAKFGLPATTLMTGAAFARAETVSTCEQPEAICYFGNVRSNRYISLGQIGQTLDEINRERGTDYRLNIYTSEKDSEILEYLCRSDSVQLCGFVTGQAFEETLRRSGLLLHVEAFDAESIDRVRHSVSTKIADSLASGVPLLAYGPGEVSSMKHLLRHDCAMVATRQEELRQTLLTAFTDAAVRTSVVNNALRTAKDYHDSMVNSGELLRILEKVCRDQ